jgi:diguanylate cyclase (GGDEF)-like protein/PAS domain S-box-containing protein
MQDDLLIVVMAVLLVFFLWSLNQRRIDRRFHLWVIGWSLVMVHFFSLLWHPAAGLGLLLRQANIASFEILAGLCFILSEPAVLVQRRRMLNVVAVGILFGLGTVIVVFFFPLGLWLLYLSVPIGNGVAIELGRRYLGREKTKFNSLVVLILLCTAWMLGSLLLHRPELMIASIPAEIFLINAILFATTYSMSRPGVVTSVIGFVLWAGTAAFSIALHNMGAADAWFPSILHLPEFFVAIGMTMIAFEDDTQAAQELAHEYETLFNANPNSIWIYDRHTLQFLSVNEVAAQKHGYTIPELLTKKLPDMLPPDRHPTAESYIASAKPVENRRTLHLHRNGSTFPVSVTAYDVRFRGCDARMAIGVDLTELDAINEQLVYHMEYDALTSLPNRRKLLSLLAAIFDQAQREKTACAVLVLQVERSERINEIYGYAVGDAVLQEVARLLRSITHPLDAIGRTGGDQFTIGLAALSSDEEANRRAQQVQSLFEGLLAVEGYRLDVSVTIGLAVYPEDCDDMAALWRDAIRAHTLAQKPGGQSPARLSRTLSLKQQESNRLELLMRHALLSDGFELFYQPILDRERRLHSMEALLRLRDGDGRMVTPTLFIPVAETSGIILPLGNWVIQQACRQIRSWQLAGHRVVPIAVNVSPHQIAQPSLSTDVQVTLEELELDPALLHLEVTESSVMLHPIVALENMEKLSGLGIQFSIDDFGTGFSSLDRLHQLPVSTLKIDRSFVSRMMDANGTRPIVITVISMAHALGLSVIAEGVETEDQFSTLCEMGCDLFQGFLFSRPIPATEAVPLFG